MKKLLSILGIISLITNVNSNLIACVNNEAEKPPEGNNLKLILSVLGEGNTEKWYFVILKKIINEILLSEKVIKNFFHIIMIKFIVEKMRVNQTTI